MKVILRKQDIPPAEKPPIVLEIRAAWQRDEIAGYQIGTFPGKVHSVDKLTFPMVGRRPPARLSVARKS
jgi:hypothetical protein